MRRPAADASPEEERPGTSRFVLYYAANPSYRRKGPPPALLRAIASLVVVSTVVVMGTGVGLLFIGPAAGDWMTQAHKWSTIVFVAVTALHVLGHLPRLPRVLRADYGASARWGGEVTGRSGRVLSLAGALTAGVVLAILVIPEFGPWLRD